MYKLIRDQAKP